MIKKYHIYHGVQKTHRVRYFILGFFAAFALGGTPLALLSVSGKTSGSSNTSVPRQSAWNTEESSSQTTFLAQLPWPKKGQAAYAVPEKDLFAASKEDEKAVPIASLAKVITALAILDKKPLIPGQEGAFLTLDDSDVALVGQYLRKNGTVVPVENGEKITQHQAMEAMLLVSANNMADSLAGWAFGSVDEYTQYANAMLKEKDINNTVIADASGYSPNTVSTPEDMTKIGYLYMKNPVLRALTMQEKAEIPVAGTIHNYNSFANKDGVLGIKIGNTDEAKRTYLAARIHGSGENPEDISIAVVLGADNFQAAAKDAAAVLKAGDHNQP